MKAFGRPWNKNYLPDIWSRANLYLTILLRKVTHHFATEIRKLLVKDFVFQFVLSGLVRISSY